MKRTQQRTTVGVRELRDNLRHYLDLASNGDEVIVTDRGKPLARLSTYDRKFQALVDAGHVRLADPAAVAAAAKIKPIDVGGSVSDLIERNR